MPRYGVRLFPAESRFTGSERQEGHVGLRHAVGLRAVRAATKSAEPAY